MRNFLEKEERELEGERNERERRETEKLGLEAPIFIFLTDMGSLECRGCARAWPSSKLFLTLFWEHAGAQGVALKHTSVLEHRELGSSMAPGFQNLVFLPPLIFNAPLAMVLHT